jgi:hypothetical protein
VTALAAVVLLALFRALAVLAAAIFLSAGALVGALAVFAACALHSDATAGLPFGLALTRVGLGESASGDGEDHNGQDVFQHVFLLNEFVVKLTKFGLGESRWGTRGVRIATTQSSSSRLSGDRFCNFFLSNSQREVSELGNRNLRIETCANCGEFPI